MWNSRTQILYLLQQIDIVSSFVSSLGLGCGFGVGLV